MYEDCKNSKRRKANMSELFKPFALNTNIAKGYSLRDALMITKSNGFQYVEIASIAGTCEHITPAQMSGDFASEVVLLLRELGLSAYSFSGHLNLTVESELNDFLKKMEFAAAIGAKIVNTNSGPVSRIKEFKGNLKKIISIAEKLNIKVGLESHGDIIASAQTAASLLKEINHPLIRLNYDTGNTYYYAKGKISIQEDIKYGLAYMDHIHLKDIHIEGNRAFYCPIGEGDIDFKEVFKVIKTKGTPVACGLEIPVFVCGSLESLSSEGAPISHESIDFAVKKSVNTISILEKSLNS